MLPGPKIVVLLTAAQFQAALPTIPGAQATAFPDSPAGVEQFAAWLRPHWRRLSSSDSAPVFCIVGGEHLPSDHSSTVALRIQMSEPPFSAFEPFSASVRLISEFERSNGIVRRALEEALRLCADGR